MNPPSISLRKRTRTAIAALAVAAVPFAATTATASASTPTPAPKVTSVIAIGGYVFYNMSYLDAVAAWKQAVAAAPAGYQPAPVTSVSVSTTVSGTVAEGNR